LAIINEEIFLFFSENNLLQNDQQYFEGNFIAGDGKIFLIIKGIYNTFYEIGHFNSNNDFIIEYFTSRI
jgi:hypothetical protein